MKKFYVTTPIYYVNDKPHLGHAYTTIAADILARYYRMKLGGDNVWFLTGTDEHGVKIAQAAEKKGVAPQAFTDEVSAAFQFAWDQLNISNNDFIRTTEPRHEAYVKKFVEKLKAAKGSSGDPVLFKDTYEGLYCYGCEAYKTGDEIVENKCPLHPTYDLAHLKEDNWFFRLSDFGEALKKKITSGEIKIQPDAREKEILGMLKEGLDDIAISRANVEWGIKLPFDDTQTVYVWIDALLNYLSALEDKKLTDKFWPADAQLLAKDILKFHAIIWPSILMAVGMELPKTIFAHGFFTIDGQKMSKSIGNVIDPNELIEKYGSDGARYLIISQFQFGGDGDIKAEDFKTKFNADLANGIGNLVSRVIGMAEKYFDSKVPKAKYAAEFDLKKFWKELDAGYEKLAVFENLQVIMNAVKWCDGYIAETKPWELAKAGDKKLNEVIYNLLEIIRHLSYAILPYLPETAEKIWHKLGIEKDKQEKFTDLQKVGLLKAGGTLEKGEALFMRLE
jgi:methionyl-tRNA synthetase